MIQALQTFALVGLVGAATVTDLSSRRIPNVLTLAGLATALALRALVGGPALASGALAAIVALVLAVPLVALGGLGGGDAKLLAAVGGFLGLEALPAALFGTALAGGLLAVAMVVHNGAARETMSHCATLARRLTGRGGESPPRTLATPGVLAVPYGVAIAAGALVGVVA